MTGAPAGPALRRTIGPFQLTMYALGSMLGSGIYGLIGQAAGQVGALVWAAFLVALVAALLTALSYASLGSRFPRAGGAAYAVDQAFGRRGLSFFVGLALVCSGLTSIATQLRIFAANLAQLAGWAEPPTWLIAVGALLVLAAIVVRGIQESMWTNVLCTLVEAGGLLLVVAVGVSHWGGADLFAPLPGAVDHAWLLVIQGAALTFFSFIGFEDAINVAEETRNPERTIPVALISAMLLAAALYVAIAVTAVSVLSPAALAAAPAPLGAVMQAAAPWFPAISFTLITLFAVANTALVNYVTASRLLYGMARQGLLPAALGRVHARSATPHVAIALLFCIAAPLTMLATSADLAAATVLLLLTVFAIVNAALVRLKRNSAAPHGRFEVPLAVPVVGAAVCAVLVAVRALTGDPRAPLIAGALALGIVAFDWALRRAGRA